MATEVIRGDPGVTPFHAHWNRRIDALAMGTLQDDVFISEVMRLGNHARESPWAVIAIMDRRVKLGQLAPELVREVELRVAQREFGSQDAELTVDLPLQPTRYVAEPTVELPVRPPDTPRRVPTQRIRRMSSADMASSTLIDAQPAAPAREVPQVNELATGSVLAERYVIRGLLGDGGMGRVYKALDRQRREQFALEPHVAVKLLRERTQEPQALARLHAEFDALKLLDHHNIVRVYDLGRDGALDFFTMEFLVGELLSKFMTRFHGEPLPREEAWSIIRDIGAALEHAHAAGVVHGDLTPRNVMMLRNGDIKLMDFGAAAAAGEVGQVTPGYASLELLVGMAPEARDDLFALACIGYELLDGRHPFDHRPAGEARDAGIVPASPPGLSATQWQWLQTALAFERAGRPASVSELLVGLGLQSGPVAAPPRSAAVRARTPVPPTTTPQDDAAALERSEGLPARAPGAPPKPAALSIEEQFVRDSVRAAAATRLDARPAPAPVRQTPPAAEPTRTRAPSDLAPAALEKTAALPPLVLPPREAPPAARSTPLFESPAVPPASPQSDRAFPPASPLTATGSPVVMASWLGTAPPNKTLPLSESRPVPATPRALQPARPAQKDASPWKPVPPAESLALMAPWLATAAPNKTLPLSDERTWPATPPPPPLAGAEQTAVLPALIVPPSPQSSPPPATASRQSDAPFRMDSRLANARPDVTLPLSDSWPPVPTPPSTPAAALEQTAELPVLVIPPSSLPSAPPMVAAAAAAPGPQSAPMSWRASAADGGRPSLVGPRLSPAPLVPLAVPPPAQTAPLFVETLRAPEEASPLAAASWQAAAAGSELPGVVESWQSPAPAAAGTADADAWQSAVPGRESLVVEPWQPPAMPKRPSFAVDDWQPHTARNRLLALGGVVLLAAGVWVWHAQAPDDVGEAVLANESAAVEATPPTDTPSPVPAPAAVRATAAAKPVLRPAPRPLLAPPGGTVSIAATAIKVRAGARYAEIKVTRTEINRPLTFTWWTEDGSARAGIDYVARTKTTAYLAAGTRSATLFVKTAGNSPHKQAVRFTVRIARPSAGVLGDSAASVTLAAH